MPILNFLKYNNALPIAISIALLGGASAFAATDPNAVLATQQQVLSVDNTYLVNKDLSAYTPKIEITSVTEDSDNYYVNYTLYTIDLKDYVWQDIARDETMTVSKADLGPYRDLGVYVEGKMSDIVNRELARLKETQADARSNPSQEVVATQYGGLVGKFLSPTTQTLPGYTPVVTPPAPPPPAQTASAATPSTPNATPTPPSSTAPDTSSTSNPAPSSSSGTPSAPSTAPSAPSSLPSTSSGTGPTIQILGNNPARITVGSSYVDLGAVVTQPANSNLGIHVFVNGTEVQAVSIDTSKPRQWAIMYKTIDQGGNASAVTRVVIVYDPNAAVQQAASSTPPASQPATSTQDQSGSVPTTSPSDTSSSTSSTSTDATSTDASSTPVTSDSSGSDASSTPAASDTGTTDASSTPPAPSTPTAPDASGTDVSSTDASSTTP